MMKKILTGTILAGALAGGSPCFAGLLYEPQNYAAQDNLVCNLDGIRNAGLLKAHDSVATEWKNVGRAANNATFTAKSGDASAWVADGYHFAGGAYGKLRFKQNMCGADTNMTVQIVVDAKGSENTTKWPTFFGCPEDWVNIYYSDKNSNLIHFKADAITGLGYSGRAAISSWGGRYLNAALNSFEHKQILVQTDSFQTGWKEGSGGSQKAPGSLNWYFGSCGNSQSDLDDRYLVGTIKAIRVYNKILSNEELAANRVIDEARFFTGIPVTNVVVETAVLGLNGNEGGVFAYDEDGYTFTAPQKATKDGVVYACAGYTLETWNGTGWSAPVSYQSTSCSLSDMNAKYRLTWQWQRAHAEVPVALDPLFDDYVTDGLIMQLDGIRNVGADKPHSWTSPQWLDLVSGNNVGSFQHDYADASTWMDDGYYFGGRSFAQFVNALSGLTNMVTVQVVCDTTTNALQTLKTSSDPYIFWPNLVGTGDNDQLNIYYDMNGNKRGRLTFKNANGGNVNLANNADKDAWEGRYVTAIRDNTTKKNYIIQGTSLTGAASVNAASGNISANTLRIGSAGGTLGKREQRWFLGVIKAVRIYNRVLSDEELAQNRVIDEARFFGVGTEPNVVVASSVRGVDGNEPEGSYVLPAGGHTFTAPASVTVGEDTYSCTGYTLETWDGSAWGTAETHSGVFAAALTDTTAKVRLTWQWAHTAGPGYDAAFSDYVTDGLVLHLDGIRNVGAQAAHDSGALQWADLANPGDNARLVIPGASCGWTSDGYRFDGKSVASYAVMNTTRTLGNTFTAQAVVDFDCNASPRITTAWPAIFGATAPSGDPFAMYFNQNNVGDTRVCFKVANTHFIADGVKPWGGEYMTGMSDGTTGALFQTATPASTVAFDKSVGTQTFTFCGGNGGDSGYDSRRFNGIGKAARIYNRALTDEELARNRAADEVRFFGRAPSAATGELIVRSDIEGLSGNQPNGAYRPAAGYQFTAQTEAVLDGVPYELKGYTLETWDGSAWSAADVHDGVFAVAPDVTTASKRLIWNWVVKSRLTKIPEYDVGDYVQDGLYLFFDGIRNAGADVAHSDNATTWVNLGTGGASLNATFDYGSNASAGDGWGADGYHFKYGGKFAGLEANPNFDGQCYVTIQVVCEAETGTAPYPTMFGSTNDFLNVYSSANATLLVGKIFNNRSEVKDSSGKVTTAAGGRHQMSGTWEKKYANLDWHAGKYQVFQSAVPDPAKWFGRWRYNWSTFKNQPFYIGGVYFADSSANTNDRRLTGKIQALRVYTRSLSDEELEHNRMVDEARFKGNLPTSNVTIAAGEFDTIEEDVGNYRVDGTYTFTASVARDSEGKKRRVRGVNVEEWNGSAWVPAGFSAGDSYTYNATSGKKIRLTWQWKGNGTRIILR